MRNHKEELERIATSEECGNARAQRERSRATVRSVTRETYWGEGSQHKRARSDDNRVGDECVARVGGNVVGL